MIDGREIYKKFICPSPCLKGNKIHNIGFHIADHCNMNCANCAHFSPLASPHFPDKYELTKDLTRLSKLTKHKSLDVISIMGGEPLLNPDVIYYMIITRKLFPKTHITLMTNGLLLPKMSKEFWETLKSYKIVLVVSKYMPQKWYKNIEKLIKKHKCEELFGYAENPLFNCVTFIKNTLSKKSGHTSKEAWDFCPTKNTYLVLNNSRLYPCSICAFLHILENRFNEGFSIVDTKDGINIHNNSYKEIIKFLKQPKETCKYCDFTAFDKIYFPKVATQNREDWIK